MEPYLSWRAAARLAPDLSACKGCRSCWLRCGARAEVSEPEGRVLLAYLRRDPARARLRRIMAQDRSVDLGDGVRVSLCRLFDVERRECAAYAVRPLVCRLLGHVEWMPCPVGQVRRAAPSVAALGLMARYARWPRRPMEEWLAAGAADARLMPTRRHAAVRGR
ncbi:MAG TPA: YkgJ family cysteine cluster protein [Chthonomonadales bacterium]|nr:YkgJ family cysteine cluster protein [Chthonomonadales bacterium]